jgi:hypothetical protein
LRVTLAILVALFALPAVVLAQAPRPAPLDTRCVLRVSGMERAIERLDLTYRASADSVRGFDLYLPPGTTRRSRVPLVVFFNAGSGNNPPQRKWGIYRDWAKLVTTRGMAALVPDAGQGAGTADMTAVLDHVRARAAEFGVDSGRVALWACSMHVPEGNRFGMDPARGIDALVLYYGVADTAALDPEKPVLLARAGLDGAGINNAMGAWATKAIRLGAPLTWIDLPSLHHAFDAFEDDALSRSTVVATLDFLERELSPAGMAARAGSAGERLVRRLSAAGDWPAAQQAAERWLAASPNSGEGALALANVSYQLRDYARAAAQYERAGDAGVQRGNAWYNAACCHALLGDREKSLALLQRVTEIFRGDRSGWARDPDLASLREEPRFRAMLAP